jgi:hypothetical protein
MAWQWSHGVHTRVRSDDAAEGLQVGRAHCHIVQLVRQALSGCPSQLAVPTSRNRVELHHRRLAPVQLRARVRGQPDEVCVRARGHAELVH